MNEPILWALVGAVFSGIHGFGFKIIAERKYNTHFASLISYFVASVFSFAFVAIDNFSGFKGVNLAILSFFAFGNILFFYLSIVTRVKSMENIDNVIFYPIYKTFGPIIVSAISVFIFKESLTQKEVLGIFLGILIPLMLLSHSESKRQKNLAIGIVFLLLTALLSGIGPAFVKLSVNFEYDTLAYVSICSLAGTFFALLGYNFGKGPKKSHNKEGIGKIGVMMGAFQFIAFYAFVKSLEGNMAIAYTINSFSLLIPIMLSIVFYGEHFNLRKGIVIALSIVSILLFI